MRIFLFYLCRQVEPDACEKVAKEQKFANFKAKISKGLKDQQQLLGPRVHCRGAGLDIFREVFSAESIKNSINLNNS